MRASCSSPMGPKNDAGAPLSRARNHRRHDQQAFAAARGLTQTELRHHARMDGAPMKYRKHEAKDYPTSHMRGIFAAANTPFRPGDLALDEAGLRRNMRHWINDLAIDGLFVAGKQGEFFSMSLAERKRRFDIAVEETAGKAQTVLSCSDQNLDVVIELARHAEAIGGDYIIVHAPMLHFHDAQDDACTNIIAISRRRFRSASRCGAIPTAAICSAPSCAPSSPTSRTWSRSNTACRARCT